MASNTQDRPLHGEMFCGHPLEWAHFFVQMIDVNCNLKYSSVVRKDTIDVNYNNCYYKLIISVIIVFYITFY